jgi:DNA-binding XRE family transcriptional regulator
MRPADLALVASTRADLVSGAARAQREDAGVSQAEIAGAIGLSRQAVSKWESGRSVPSAPHALAYGRLLRQLGRKAA